MRLLIISIISIFTLQLSYAQINEIGIFAGGSNVIGDVGATTYISPRVPAVGLIYKWNASPRHSWRASVIYSNLSGRDNESDDPRRIIRDYGFNTGSLEIATGFEFTFLDFDLHERGKKATPYLFTGINMTIHGNYYFANNVMVDEESNNTVLGIPMGLGFKTNFLGPFILGIEVGARYTFSDGLDGSMPKSKNLEPLSFGNINNNDWYVFSGITLTYTFGENACYCFN